jgi:multiple sugar transport system permease protein
MTATATAPARRRQDENVATKETPSGRTSPGRVLGIGLLLLITLLYLAPLAWMLVTSFKTSPEATTWPLSFLPDQAITEPYDTLTRPGTGSPILRWFGNSLLAATLHALLVVATAAPAAYALARMEFPGRKAIFGLIIATLFVPPIILIMPNFMIVDALGWLNSIAAVIVPTAAGAFGVFFLRQFFVDLPLELEEAARVDGANRWEIFWRVVLPLARPALVTLAVLSFLTNWNDFLWPVYVLFTPEALTIPPGLGQLQNAYTTDYPIIMAGGVLASLPVLILFTFAQRYVIEGVARTGIKG